MGIFFKTGYPIFFFFSSRILFKFRKNSFLLFLNNWTFSFVSSLHWLPLRSWLNKSKFTSYSSSSCSVSSRSRDNRGRIPFFPRDWDTQTVPASGSSSSTGAISTSAFSESTAPACLNHPRLTLPALPEEFLLVCLSRVKGVTPYNTPLSAAAGALGAALVPGAQGGRAEFRLMWGGAGLHPRDYSQVAPPRPSASLRSLKHLSQCFGLPKVQP